MVLGIKFYTIETIYIQNGKRFKGNAKQIRWCYLVRVKFILQRGNVAFSQSGRTKNNKETQIESKLSHSFKIISSQQVLR